MREKLTILYSEVCINFNVGDFDLHLDKSIKMLY